MTRTIFIVAALAFAATLPAVPANAQASRTFVSAAGSDSDNCTTVATPCRHLQTAYSATTIGGEIVVLDPANYGSLTITGPISIEGNNGWAFLSAASGAAAITINAAGATDKINIRGVVLDGLGTSGNTGIQFNSGGSLTVRDSVIRNFGSDGILFQQPNSSGLSQLFVSNTLVSDNGSVGIEISPFGTGTTTGVLDHVLIENNASTGLDVASEFQTVNVTVTDSVSANNGGVGIAAGNSLGMPIRVVVRNSTIANNASIGLNAEGPGADILVTRSTITGNSAGWAGPVESYTDNNIDGNGSYNTEPANTLTYK